ncbi:hypothetical protein, partial [Herpetosiphon gulosus]|uniref:hypothetical protein n=1 Tax=Herpetosiphon gulosus TaxID=1973496 RepID=UPI0031ED0C4D
MTKVVNAAILRELSKRTQTFRSTMFAQHHTFDENAPLSCFNRSGGFFIAKIAPFQLMGAASAA